MPLTALGSATALQADLRAAGLRVLDPVEHARDFGGDRECLPLAAAGVRSEAEIAAALAVAGRARVPVTVRGTGHSCGGQSLGAGLALCLLPGEAPAPVGPTGTWRVPAGTRWQQVEEALAGAGKTFPVLTDYLELSVGGTLSVGGYGVRSIARGAQIDHVRAIRLVLPDGTIRTCSAEREPALYRHALAGYGPVGVIASADLAPVARPAACDLFHVGHTSLREAAASLARVAAPGALAAAAPGPDSFFAVREPWHPGARAVWGFDRRPGEGAARWPPVPALAQERLATHEVAGDPAPRTHRRRAALLAAFPEHLHLWQDFVVGAAVGERLAALADGELDGLAAAGKPGRAPMAIGYLLAIHKRESGVAFPFEAAPGGREASYAGIGLYCFAPLAAPAAHAVALAGLTRFGRAALALGARPYRYGALAPPDPRAIYGAAALDTFAAVRAATDPTGILSGPPSAAEAI